MTGDRDAIPRDEQASSTSDETAREASRPAADLLLWLLSEQVGRETAQQILQQLTAANDNSPRMSRGQGHMPLPSRDILCPKGD
jgi:hypothetical protein